MNKVLHIIDNIYPNLEDDSITACLFDTRNYKNDINILKIFQIEQEELKEKLLNFTATIANNLEEKIKNKDIYRYLISSNIIFEKSPYKTDYIYLFYKLNIVLKYIDNNNIKSIQIHSSNTSLIKFFNKFVASKNISLDTTNSKNNFSIKQFIMKNNTLSFIFKLYIESKKIKKKLIRNKKNNKKLVVSYYPNYFFEKNKFISRYFSDISKKLNIEYDWLFIYADNIEKIKYEENILKKNDFQNYNFLDSFINYKDFFEIYKKNKKILKELNQINLKTLFIYNGINYSDIVIDDWKKSLAIVLIDTLIFEKKFYNFFQKYNYDEVIYLMEYQPWENMLNKILHTKNIISKGTTHSVIRPNLVNYFHHQNIHDDLYLPDFVGANGDGIYYQFLKNSFNKEQVLKIEAQRFNYLDDINLSETKNNNSLLITTSIDEIETKELLRTFAKAYQNELFKTIYIKSHPDLPIDNIIKQINNFPIYKILSGSMQEAFKNANIIYTTNSSSVLLEALLNKKRTITLFSLKSLPMSAINKHPLLFIATSVKKLNIILSDIHSCNNSKIVDDNMLYLNKQYQLWDKFLDVK